jgi:hypothetical protein
MAKVGNFAAKGKDYLWKFSGPNAEPKKIEGWRGGYEQWLLDAAGYVIKGVNKRDGVPIVQEKIYNLTREESIKANLLAEALRLSTQVRRRDL